MRKDDLNYFFLDFNKRFKTCFLLEVQGIPFRKFKFDFADSNIKIAVEYEGLMSTKSRHTTVTGYTTDCEKYNLAQIHGWRVLRYTVLSSIGQMEKDLKQLI